MCRQACYADRDCSYGARCVYRASGGMAQPIESATRTSGAGDYENIACELPDGTRVPPPPTPLASWYRRSDESVHARVQCLRNSECSGNLVCIAGFCHAQCLENRDCGRAGVCVNAPPSDPSGSTVYWEGCAQDPQYNRCAGPGERSRTPSCTPPAGTGRTRIAYGLMRGPRCFVNSDCVEGLRCDPFSGACVKQCIHAIDCGRGEICSYRGRDATVVDLDANPAPAGADPYHFVCELPPPPPAPPSRAASGSATIESVGEGGQSSRMDGINLPGGDYRHYVIGSDRNCMSACLYEPRCQAWTYVSAASTCWLKLTRTMPQQNDSCCVSGYKLHDAALPAAAGQDLEGGGRDAAPAAAPPAAPPESVRETSIIGRLFSGVRDAFSRAIAGIGTAFSRVISAVRSPFAPRAVEGPRVTIPADGSGTSGPAGSAASPAGANGTGAAVPPPVGGSDGSGYPGASPEAAKTGSASDAATEPVQPSKPQPVQTGSSCGNKVCDKGEDAKSCAVDCSAPTPAPLPAQSGSVCGNKVCDKGEDAKSCPKDCPAPVVGPICGNKLCEAGEDEKSCAADCAAAVVPSGPLCGDLSCDKGEDAKSCPKDCPAPVVGPICGNKLCEAGEDAKSCPADCTAEVPPAAVCGDGVCDQGEDAKSCPKDCAA
ncbi:MAG: hypothetical protein RL272_856 [Candidatus Parcubacteria bacterium]